MKQFYFISLTLFALGFISCQNKSEKNALSSLHAELSEANMSFAMDTVDLTRLTRLTQAQYDSLQLSKVEDLKDYPPYDLCMGKVLVNNEYGKILTIQIITDGELTECLLSYDKDGNIQDNLVVAYEDLVEGYSQRLSNINMGEITVQTISYIYLEGEDTPTEQLDTLIEKYKITPEFKFVMN